MLLNLHKKTWMDGLSLQDYNEHCKLNEGTVNDMLELAKHYNKVSNHSITKLLFVIIMYKLTIHVKVQGENSLIVITLTTCMFKGY